MPTYDPVPGDVPAIIGEMMEANHPDLIEAGARVGALFARSKAGEPAVKLHGYPCAATIKPNGYKDRVEGKPDATITVDGDSWPHLSYERQCALIDHELTHLVVPRDKQGQPKRDALARPVLKTRLHDYQLGGFAEIAERHGEASFEVALAVELRTSYGQLLWDWADDDRPRRKPRRAAQEGVAVAGAVG